MARKKKLKKRRPDNQEKTEKRRLLIYYLSVVGLAVTFHILASQTWFADLIQPIYEAYATIGSAVLNVFGQETEAIGKEIRSTAFTLAIKKGCDGITPMILLCMAILAFPIQWKYKWRGAIGGLLVLFVLNVIRIVSLYFIGKHASLAIFEFIHVDVWSVAYLIMAVFVWIYWMRWTFISRMKPSSSTLRDK